MTITAKFSDSIFDTMASAISNDTLRAEGNSDAIKVIEEAKINAYAAAVLAMRDVSLVKGNLPRAVADEFDAQLVRVNLFELDDKGAIKRGGKGKRFRENLPGLIRVLRLKKISIPSQATVEAVKDIFAEHDLTAESKITAFCKAGRDKFTSKYWEAMCAGVAKITFGKDARGAPQPTGMSLGKDFKARAETIGEQEAFDEMVSELNNRFETYKRLSKAATDEANANRSAAELMETVLSMVAE